MSTAFTTRRRAEEFHELIERASAPKLADSRFAELAEALGALRAAHDEVVLPRADFATDLRAALMTAAATELVAPATSSAPARRTPAARPRTRHEKKVAAVFGGVALVTASASMAVAAQTALPGDTLYPLKRALENVHAGVQSGDGKGTTLLANASDRLAEVHELSSRRSDDPQAIAQTLDDFSHQADQASQVLLADYEQNGHVASLHQLQSFTRTSLAQLDTLASLVPIEARGSLIAAASTLHQIAQQAEEACPSCGAAIDGVATAAAHLSPFTSMSQVAASVARPVTSGLGSTTRTVVHRVGVATPPELGHTVSPAPDPSAPSTTGPSHPGGPSSPTPGHHGGTAPGTGAGTGPDGGLLGGVTKVLKTKNANGGKGLLSTVRDTVKGTTDAIDQALTGPSGH